MKTFKYWLILSGFYLFGFQEGLFAQQQLADYLVLAAQNNPAVRSAYAKFEADLQKVQQVSSLPDPTLTISALGRMIETRLGTQEARFSFMQMFPWFGTNKTRGEAATLMAEASFQNYLEVRQKVFLEVKATYYELYSLEEVIKLKEQNVNILNSYKELAISRFKSGTAPMVNALKVDIQQDAALTEIEWLEAQRLPLQTAFNLTVGRDTPLAIDLADTLSFKTEAVIISGEKEQDLLVNHPSMQGLKKQETAYELQQQLAKKEGLPNFGLGLDYSIISKRPVENLDRNGRDAIMPMLTLSLPIYRKKYRASVKEASLMQESLAFEQNNQLNNLLNSYQSTVYKLNRAKKQIALYERQIESSQQAIKLLLAGFSNGLTDFDEVLQMNQDILMYKTEKVEAVKNGLLADAELHYLLLNKEEEKMGFIDRY